MVDSVAASRSLSLPGYLTVLLAVAAGWLVLVFVPSTHGAIAFADMWLAMTMAMMVPSVLRPMQRAASGSSVRAWQFVGGFAAVWLAAGVPTYFLMHAIEWTPAWIAVLWMVAGGYQLTSLMQRNVTDCRSIRFDGRPVRYGLRQGTRCVVSCGPMMLAVMVTAMTLTNSAVAVLLLIAVTVVICWEKRPRTNARWIVAVGLALVLVGAGAYVLGGGSPAAPHHAGGMSTS